MFVLCLLYNEEMYFMFIRSQTIKRNISADLIIFSLFFSIMLSDIFFHLSLLSLPCNVQLKNYIVEKNYIKKISIPENYNKNL